MTYPEALRTLGRVNLQRKAFSAIVRHLQSNQGQLSPSEQEILDACHVVLVHIKAPPAIASGVPFDGRKS